MSKTFPFAVVALLLAAGRPDAGHAQSTCGPDGTQESGSIYRICMPPAADYNGRLVVWAHGFQDATEAVGIPEEQLCFDDVCLPDLFNGLGYGFATNSYRKTGLAVVEGAADILDLVDVFAAEQGAPEAVYVTGASLGGIITTLIAEQHPEVLDGGVAACGPIGDFNRQLEYFGNARLVFEVLWPGLLPGGPFAEPRVIAETWPVYYETVIRPALLSAPVRLREWFVAAGLPFDPDDFLASADTTAEAVLRYAVVNYADAAATLGGFPFGNEDTVYEGVLLTDYINQTIERLSADQAALDEVAAHYETTGVLDIPLVTIHTSRDEQVPYFHQPLYVDKARDSGAFLRNFLALPIDRYGHCNFSAAEALVAFALMLAYADDLLEVQGVGALLAGDTLARFVTLAEQYGVPYRLDGKPRIAPSARP
jgi:pimeloyl-ACP methyl ester carboxylesterase